MNQDNSFKHWFVLFTKPKHEQKVKENLIDIGLEAICPSIWSYKIWSDRVKKVKEVLIKSTVFVKCSHEERKKVFNIPNKIKFLFYCEKPAIVSDLELTQLNTLEKNDYFLNKNLSMNNFIFLDKVKNDGFIIRKSKYKNWYKLKKLNVTICI